MSNARENTPSSDQPTAIETAVEGVGKQRRTGRDAAVANNPRRPSHTAAADAEAVGLEVAGSTAVVHRRSVGAAVAVAGSDWVLGTAHRPRMVERWVWAD